MNNQSITLVYRNVRFLRIEVENGVVRFVVPKDFNEDINKIKEKYKEWIKTKLEKLKEIEEVSKKIKLFNHDNIEEIVKKFIDEYSDLLKVKPQEICFRKMKKRWAGCNVAKQKIIFNKDIKFLPKGLIKYITLHEMAHLIVRNHKNDFWSIISQFDTNYKQKEKLLACYRHKIINKNKSIIL
jgi:predicted metal-dependent hydrolase